jgi:glycosyltransferase involved in cell wall biosynthesis
MNMTVDKISLGAMSRVVFWEPCVSPHKSAFIGAVAEALGPSVDVVCVAHEDVPQDRQALGWNSGQSPNEVVAGGTGVACGGVTTCSRYRTIVAPCGDDISALVAQGGVQCLHVFSGIRWFSTIKRGLAEVRRRGSPFAVMSEPRDDAGMKGTARFIQSWATEGWLRRNAQFVLAIGRHGPPWFRSVGYAAERVFPFAYFLPLSSAIAERDQRDGGSGSDAVSVAPCLGDAVVRERASEAGHKIEVAYIGRLIESKGVGYLLPAIAALGARARLTLIGAGPLRETLGEQARALGIEVGFAGVLPIDVVQRRMRDFDVLVLPSLTKDDGWGAVVSEALLAGTAAIASSYAGASILLDEPSNGRIVPPGDSEAIARAIADLADRDVLTPNARAGRMSWAVARLSAQAGASHFLQIVRHRLEGDARPMEFYR